MSQAEAAAAKPVTQQEVLANMVTQRSMHFPLAGVRLACE
jgi:hypothetical protein